MNDLVFALNTNESKKSDCVIFESYLCNNKHNKQKKYNGGRITKVSIWDDIKPENYTFEELSEIRSFFKGRVYVISQFQYLAMPQDFYWLLDNHNKKNFYYYTNQLDMYLIEKCKWESIYDLNKKDTVCPIKGYDIVYDIKNAEVHFITNRGRVQSIVDINPKAKIVKADNEYRILFEYQGVEIPFNSSNYIFEYNGDIIVRKNDVEKQYEDSLVRAGFKKKKENTYEFKRKGNVTEILDQLGIALEYETKELEKNAIKVSISKSNSDWFDLRLLYDLGDETIDLGNRIDLSSNRKTVTIEGNRIILPDSIVENAEKLSQGENGLRVASTNFWTVVQIARENGLDIDDFVSYQDIKTEFDNKIERYILDYQKEGVRWLKWLYINKLGGCLADDMGVGKTFQIIAFLTEKQLKEAINKVLIIVPYVVIANWVREFKKFSCEESIMIYHGSDRSKIMETDYRIIITTYTTAMNDIESLSKKNFDVVVFDEIQYLKNDNSKTYKALYNLNSNTRIGLSGTPFENRIEELWNILNFLNPGMMIKKNKFIKKYTGDNYKELQLLLNPFILRRTKEDVLDELPDKHEELIYCSFYDKQQTLYDAIRVAVKKSMMQYSIGSNANILKSLLLLREVCCHPLLLDPSVNINNVSESCKFDALKAGVAEIINSGNKVIIYSQFVKMLKIIEDWCVDDNIEYFYIDGDTKNRQLIVDQFEKSENSVFLISIKAAGVGLNLTSAHYAIIYDPWWNPFVEQQAADRIYRIGQKNDVVIYKMIVEDSIEDKILSLQESKQKMFSDVLNGVSNEKIDLRELVDML